MKKIDASIIAKRVIEGRVQDTLIGREDLNLDEDYPQIINLGRVGRYSTLHPDAELRVELNEI